MKGGPSPQTSTKPCKSCRDGPQSVLPLGSLLPRRMEFPVNSAAGDSQMGVHGQTAGRAHGFWNLDVELEAVGLMEHCRYHIICFP